MTGRGKKIMILTHRETIYYNGKKEGGGRTVYGKMVSPRSDAKKKRGEKKS